MNNENPIPQDYEQWRYCIEVLGGMKLTQAFINQRLAVYNDPQNAERAKFVKLYGTEHLQRTIDWFRRAAKE